MATRVVEGPVIRAGESLSEPLDCTGGRIVRVIMPAAWTIGTGQESKTALSFELSNDGTNWNELCDVDGYEWQIKAVVPNSTVVVQENQIRDTHVKFRAGSCQYPVVQTEERMFKVVLEDLSSSSSGSGGGTEPSSGWTWVYSQFYGWVLVPPGGGGKPQPPVS